MNSINYDHLRYFWMVAKEGTVSKACKQLHLAQSTVSGQIIQLEKSLGKKLFERRNRRLFLTEAGRVALSYAENIFRQSQDMLDRLHDNPSKTAPLRIGYDVTISSQIMLALLEALHQWEPGLSIQIEQATLPQLMDRIRRFSCHLVVTDQPGNWGEAQEVLRKELTRLDMFFVCAPSLARAVKRFPRDLSKLPLILPVPSHPLWGVIHNYMRQHNISPVHIVEIQNPDLQRGAAIRGLGATALHDIVVRRDLEQKRLVRLGAGPTSIIKTLWLMAIKGQTPHPLVHRLMTEFRFDL